MSDNIEVEVSAKPLAELAAEALETRKRRRAWRGGRSATTKDYDPRYDKAQSVAGAKARYVELDDYSILDLERDLDRLME